jgi:radical SAM superfamily enzyme YgiQ (UPF0313 family)
MRVLLVQPPLTPAREVQPPVGLCTLASWLMKLGHQVRLLDLDLEIKHCPADEQDAYSRLFVDSLTHFHPEVVGVTSMYSNSLQGERLVRIAKQHDPNVVTLAGGPHFGSLVSQSLRRIPELDYAIAGEGELPLAALLKALESSRPLSDVPSLGYRADGAIRMNPVGSLMNLAELPSMWVTLESAISLDRYAKTAPVTAARHIILIEAGRGCPFYCTFCATAPFWQRKFRVKPVHRIVDEIRFLHEHFGYDSFILVHDLLTVNQRFITDFCDAMLEARLPVEWMANSRTDINLRGLLPKMKAAGCWKLFHGVESASDRIQNHIDKHLNMQDVISTALMLKEHGIASTYSFVIGFPDESLRELAESIGMGARLKLLGAETIQFHRLRLWPPARLTYAGIASEFDLDSLRIEYPFTSISASDISAVASDPSFFTGYFPPYSQAGSLSQLAQVEMFFHHAVALVPLTIAALGQCAKDQLIRSFYDALRECGGIARGELDWESGNLYGNWLTIQPVLQIWISKYVRLGQFPFKIVGGLLAYESRRIEFITVGQPSMIEGLTSGENWVAFAVTVDVPQIIQQLSTGAQLTAEVVCPGIVVLVRHADAAFTAYTLETSLLPDLMQHRPDLVAIFTR